jgi:squalene synthase HpnC
MSTTEHNGEVKKAFEHCMAAVRGHYENFPVASWLLPPERRPYVAALYAFARAADDMADEGSLPPEQRLRRLDAWERNLEEAYAGRASHPVFVALAATASRFAIPRQLFVDLLTAFRSDIAQRRYRSFEDLLGYCRHSANPVGRLVLLVFEDARERTNTLSDNICTALQLANFWQDLSVDLARDRLYLPLDDLDRFGYTEADFRAGRADEHFVPLLQAQVQRTRALFHAGTPLIDEVTRALRMEVVLTWRGGMAILDQVERKGAGVLHHRPALSPLRKASILISALVRMRR